MAIESILFFFKTCIFVAGGWIVLIAIAMSTSELALWFQALWRITTIFWQLFLGTQYMFVRRMRLLKWCSKEGSSKDVRRIVAAHRTVQSEVHLYGTVWWMPCCGNSNSWEHCWVCSVCVSAMDKAVSMLLKNYFSCLGPRLSGSTASLFKTGRDRGWTVFFAQHLVNMKGRLDRMFWKVNAAWAGDLFPPYLAFSLVAQPAYGARQPSEIRAEWIQRKEVCVLSLKSKASKLWD